MLQPVPLQDARRDMLFRQDTVANPGRESGDIGPVGRAKVIVPVRRIMTTGTRYKFGKVFECRMLRRGPMRVCHDVYQFNQLLF